MNNAYYARDIIYGPVNSRRLGSSLGINLWPNSHKVCSLDCVYCECGAYRALRIDDPRLDGPHVQPEDVGIALANALENGVHCESITFSGSGEPTFHPDFAEIVQKVCEVRDKLAPKSHIVLLSNSSRVNDIEIRRTISRLDLAIMKLDAGDPDTFQRINQPAIDVSFQDMVNGLASLERIHLQTLLLEGAISNSSDDQLDCWMEQVGRIKPLSVQLYTLHRPAPVKGVRPVDLERLEEIARHTEARTGVPVKVFY